MIDERVMIECGRESEGQVRPDGIDINKRLDESVAYSISLDTSERIQLRLSCAPGEHTCGKMFASVDERGGGWYRPENCVCGALSFLGTTDEIKIPLRYILEHRCRPDIVECFDLGALPGKIPNSVYFQCMGILKEENGYLDLARRCMDRLHVGDNAVKMITLLSAVTMALRDKLHVMIISDRSGSGKSHIIRCMKDHLFMGRYEQLDSSSSKHLVYRAKENTRIFRNKALFVDEYEDNYLIQSLLKAFTDPGSDEVLHGTVIQQNPVLLHIKGKPVVQVALCGNPPTDKQKLRRFTVLPGDATDEQQVIIREHFDGSEQDGYDPRKDDDVRLFRYCTDILFKDACGVVIPYSDMIEYPSEQFTDYLAFHTFLKAIVFTNRFNRMRDDHDRAVATVEDFGYAVGIWKEILSEQQLKLSREMRRLYDTLDTVDGFSYNELMEKLGKSYKMITKEMGKLEEKNLVRSEWDCKHGQNSKYWYKIPVRTGGDILLRSDVDEG